MKTFGKHLFPGVHIDPIQRDLLVIFTTGMLIAAALILIGFALLQ